MISQGKYF